MIIINNHDMYTCAQGELVTFDTWRSGVSVTAQYHSAPQHTVQHMYAQHFHALPNVTVSYNKISSK